MVSSTLLPWERTQWPRSPQRHRGAPQQWLLEVLASQQVSHAGAPLPRLLPRSMTARSLSTQTLHLITYCQDHLAIQTFCQKLLAIQTFSQKVYVLFWDLFRYVWKRKKKKKSFINLYLLLWWWDLVHFQVTTMGLNNWILCSSMNLQKNKSNVGRVGIRLHGFGFPLSKSTY